MNMDVVFCVSGVVYASVFVSSCLFLVSISLLAFIGRVRILSSSILLCICVPVCVVRFVSYEYFDLSFVPEVCIIRA